MTMPEVRFPLTLNRIAADGRPVEFKVTASELPGVYIVQAEETDTSRGRMQGYMFESHSRISPDEALADVIGKIDRELVVRYLERSDDGPWPTHDELKCRIERARGVKRIVLEVDGEAVSRDQFWRIVSSHEGWEMDIRFRST